MPRRHFPFDAIAIVAVGCFAIAPRPAHAIGYYNVPGSFCQCFGYGNGAGHHACLVLGPLSCRGFCDTKEVRLECPPQPPYAYYNCYPYGAYGPPLPSTWLDEPVPVRPAVQAPAPTPAAMRPQVLRPRQVW